MEVDVSDENGFTSYRGQVLSDDCEKIISGEFDKEFLKIENVFWIEKNKDEDEAWKGEKHQLHEYGKGDYSEYEGVMFVRTDIIIGLHILKGGPDLYQAV